MEINAETIKPLPQKEISAPEWFLEDSLRMGYWNNRLRLIFFNPTEIYQRISHLINPYRRNQGKLTIEALFPKNDNGDCRCGCGQKAKFSWADQNCKNFAYRVYSIIAYGTKEAKVLLHTYYGSKCCECNENDWEDIDHIIPVKHGGGGCWLGNFKPLCKPCHKTKTKKDFNWKEFKQPDQIDLFIKK
jgi:5-methylcytosine-specific restriction endonuclease McrA